jgi:hypothetical protein
VIRENTDGSATKIAPSINAHHPLGMLLKSATFR